MNVTAIRVEKLSKKYRIGTKQEGYRTLRDTLADAVMSPFRRATKLLRGQAYGASALDETIWALKDVSFEIKRGEVVGIIGRNGAGKTTLLKILSRITEPTEGEAEIHGRVGSLLEVGTGFHPELTGRENIYLNGAILGMKKTEIEQKFDEIVGFAEVERFIDTPVKHYSSGMYVRLAFAVAAHLEPDILLVDEVLAVGDMAFQKKCLGRMGKVASEGKTVLFVSHNMGAISELCDKSILLSQGRIRFEGETKRVLEEYLAVDSKEGRVELQDWSLDRQGQGPMRILHLSIQDTSGRVQSQFKYGEEITFNIGVRGSPTSVCIVGVSIRDPFGHLILHLNNTDDATEVVLPAHESEISVVLPHNILNDGTYYATVWLGDGLNMLHDRVGNCLSFMVESSTEGNIRSLGSVRVPARWRVSSSQTRWLNKGQSPETISSL
jgi:lipopolysaccharide transport system ATP-binding protein